MYSANVNFFVKAMCSQLVAFWAAVVKPSGVRACLNILLLVPWKWDTAITCEDVNS